MILFRDLGDTLDRFLQNTHPRKLQLMYSKVSLSHKNLEHKTTYFTHTVGPLTSFILESLTRFVITCDFERLCSRNNEAGKTESVPDTDYTLLGFLGTCAKEKRPSLFLKSNSTQQ